MLRQTNFLSISIIYELFVIDWHVDSINQIFFRNLVVLSCMGSGNNNSGAVAVLFFSLKL